jgi:hypothetical protein
VAPPAVFPLNPLWIKFANCWFEGVLNRQGDIISLVYLCSVIVVVLVNHFKNGSMNNNVSVLSGEDQFNNEGF